jgi:Galactose oxidase, central domain
MKLTGKRLGRLPHLPLSLLVVFVNTSSAVAQAPGTFIPIGNTTTPRSGHTATLLLNGKVLITGGSRERPGSAELFDPVTGTFTATGRMTTARLLHSATLLSDGRVLIAGGDGSGTAELYDPASGIFTPTGHMVTTQYWHTATLLNNGKVLIAGGVKGCPGDGCYVADRPELYDPVTGTFTPTGDYADKTPDPWLETAGFLGAPATLLPNGKVLIAADPMAELYDPADGTFGITAQMTRGAYVGQVPGWEIGGTSTLLASGKVLLAGGTYFETGYYDAAELYDPSTSHFTAISSMTTGRDGHTATLLRDGTVLIAGGYWASPPYGSGEVFAVSSELYDPASGIFTAAADMTSPRAGHTATLLMDGRILMVGGHPDSASAELYIPSVLIPAQVVNGLRVDKTDVVAGTTYSVTVSGSNLTSQTFFDVRFISPDSNESAVVLNWQRGLVANHDVPAGIASGNWTINGVRAHEIETDHTGSFFPVNARITVSVN